MNGTYKRETMQMLTIFKYYNQIIIIRNITVVVRASCVDLLIGINDIYLLYVLRGHIFFDGIIFHEFH